MKMENEIEEDSGNAKTWSADLSESTLRKSTWTRSSCASIQSMGNRGRPVMRAH